MRRMLILLLAAALLPLTFALDAEARVHKTAAAASPSADKKVEQRHKEWIRLTGQILRHRPHCTKLWQIFGRECEDFE